MLTRHSFGIVATISCAAFLVDAQECLAQVSSGRRDRIATLRSIINDDRSVKEERDKVVASIIELGRLHAWEAASDLAEKLDFHVNELGVIKSNEPPPFEQEYPAIKSLIEIGGPSLPAIAQAIAKHDRSRRFVLNAGEVVQKVTGSFITVQVTFSGFADIEPNSEGAVRLRQAADMYKYRDTIAEQKRRQEALMKVVADEKKIHTDPSKMEQSIRELGKRKAWIAISELVDRLDFKGSTGTDQSDLRASVESQYPACEALLEIGPSTLPYIIWGCATKDRSEVFRRNASYLVVKIVGGKEPARAIIGSIAATQPPERSKQLKLVLDEVPAGSD